MEALREMMVMHAISGNSSRSRGLTELRHLSPASSDRELSADDIYRQRTIIKTTVTFNPIP